MDDQATAGRILRRSTFLRTNENQHSGLFPEKRRLIDSISRDFDIASLYFYRHTDGTLDCVDGRQRINTIMSFLKRNPDDKNDGFKFQVMNEVYGDAASEFSELNGKDFGDIEAGTGKQAGAFVRRVLHYKVAVVTLSDSGRPDEFNLQFTRLNLGTLIISGEKLNAMVGELRDACYLPDGLSSTRLMSQVKIPTRRFAKEQVAAQMVQQLFRTRGE